MNNNQLNTAVKGMETEEYVLSKPEQAFLTNAMTAKKGNNDLLYANSNKKAKLNGQEEENPEDQEQQEADQKEEEKVQQQVAEAEAEEYLKQVMSRVQLREEVFSKGGSDITICRYFGNGYQCPQIIQYGVCTQTHCVIVKSLHEIEADKKISKLEKSRQIQDLIKSQNADEQEIELRQLQLRNYPEKLNEKDQKYLSYIQQQEETKKFYRKERDDRLDKKNGQQKRQWSKRKIHKRRNSQKISKKIEMNNEAGGLL